VANLDLGVGIAELSAGINGYSMTGYPNPFTDRFEIKYILPEEHTAAISIVDVTGKEIYATVLPMQIEGTVSLNLNTESGGGTALKEGVYFCRLIVDGRVVSTNKMIKIR
jgi:hypothetical protein